VGVFFLVQFGEKALWRPVILSALLNVAAASFREESECGRRESGRCLPATTECADSPAVQTDNLRYPSSSDSERLHSASSPRIFVLQRCDKSAIQHPLLVLWAQSHRCGISPALRGLRRSKASAPSTLNRLRGIPQALWFALQLEQQDLIVPSGQIRIELRRNTAGICHKLRHF